jgi:arylsulfatase A-like enzyme
MDTTVISEEEWRTAIQFGYRHAMAVDESIGMLLDALDDNRLADDTYVFFVADHGDMGGAHGRFDKGAYFYEEVWRIPLIVAGPAISESVRHEFVSILDVGATLSSLSGATRERVSRRDGRSLLPMTVESANGQLGAADAETFPQLAFGRYDLYNGMSFAVRSVRDERYTYVWNPQDVDELYDNDDDPAQLSNRIHDPSLRPVRIRLRAELDAFMEDTFDDLSRRASELPAAGTIVATGRPGP